MSHLILLIKKIESLNNKELADALEFNGYGECVAPIRSKNIDGEQFLKLTEVQISLWRLPITQSRRLWSFIQQIKLDPTQLLLDVQKKSRDRITTIKKNSNTTNSTKRNDQQSFKGSSLTKQESKLFKSKLEEMFKKESEEIPNTSFIHNHKYPRLPPKPDHLKIDLINGDGMNDPVDDYDGYLSPIKIEHKSIDHIFEAHNSSTFLSKYRRASASFEKSADRISKQPNTRPLPPIPAPKLTDKNPPMAYESDDDDEMGNYTPVLEIGHLPENQTDEIPEYTPVDDSDENTTVSPSKRPLPPIPTVRHEELPEYTHIADSDEHLTPLPSKRPLPPIPFGNYKESPEFTHGKRPLPAVPISKHENLPRSLEENNVNPEDSIRSTVFRTPPPPEVCSSNSDSLKRRVKPGLAPAINKDMRDQHENKFAPDTRPRSMIKLPKPPVDLPLPFFDTEESVVEKLKDLNLTSSHLENDDDDDGDEDETGDGELKDAPFYRETDRKGARLLLTGLTDGAFLIRPSRQDKYVCTLSIMHTRKMFNVGIQRDLDGTLIFESSNDILKHPKFYSIYDVVEYYSRNPIKLWDEYILLKHILPPNKR